MTETVSQHSRRREKVGRGLYRRVTASGETRFDLVVYQGGKQAFQALPRGTTEAQARKAALKARAQAVDGAFPMASGLRFSQLVDDYLADAERRTRIDGKGRMSETTVRTYRSRLSDYVVPVVGSRKLAQLSTRDVLAVVDRCHAERFSDWSTHGVLVAFRAVLRYARENKHMTHDPFAAVPRDRLPAQSAAKEARALRAGEVSLLLAMLRDRKPKVPTWRRDYALGCLLADAGLRVSEACGLAWGDLSLTEGLLQVRGQLAPMRAGEAARIVPPKSKRGYRTVPLTPRLQAALEDLLAGEPAPPDTAFVLRTRNGSPLTQRNAGRTIERAGERAKLGKVTPHALRRSLGTALASIGYDRSDAAAILGHSSDVYERNYVKAHRDEQARTEFRDVLVASGYGTK